MDKESFIRGTNMQETINVVMITDDEYAMPTCVALCSIIANCKAKQGYVINILCDNVSKSNKYALGKYANERIKINLIDVDTSIFNEIAGDSDDIYLVANKTALIKFLLPVIFKDLDKILYLDGDLIVNCDLEEIFSVDLKDNFVAAVRDLPQVLLEPQLIGGDISGVNYFNSGVMLLNLKKMRENNTFEELVRVKKERTADTLMDQNVFNVVFKDKVIQLDLCYNVCYCNYKSTKRLKYEKLKNYYKEDYSCIENIKKKAKIIHYSSCLKPWVYYDAPLALIWTKTYYQSSFKNYPLHRISCDGATNVSYKKNREKLKIINEADVIYPKGIVPIVLCSDYRYSKFAMVTIQSIIDNAKSNTTEYRIYIFHDDEFLLRDKVLFKQMETENVKIECLDVRYLIDKNELYSRAHYSKQMFYRWLIPEVLPQYSKVIYVDCDMIVNTDIKKLYDIPIGEKNVIGAVKNRVQDEKMRNYLCEVVKINPEQYINSGLLVIYTHKFLFRDIKTQCMDILKNNGVFLCPDQDVLNIVLKDEIKYLDETWNFQWANLKFTNYDKYKKMYNIVHYTSGVKPWKMNGINLPLAELFWKYARETSRYEEIIYSSINFQIGKRLNEVKPQRKKRESTFVKAIKWPFRTIKFYLSDKKEKNKEYARKQLKARIKYGINKLKRKNR